ncbi:MAG: dienelactone hydrolase family protein [Myxococcales bacterium]|nr:dienelactone hydrolase family protein [Myxococcales bacterium]
MWKKVELSARGGGKSQAVLAEPAEQRAPGLVLVHEWWGLNDDMRSLAERFAGQGFLALAVDLYDGESTADGGRAMELAGALQTPAAVKIIEGAADFLRAHPRGNGKVGVTGFCLGGAMALAAVCSVEELAAAVPFYGIPKPEYADFTRAKAPILAHFGRQDPVIAVERAEALASAAKAAGAAFELCLYDAGHAFMRASDPSAHHPESEALAWSRTLAFLRRHLV